MTVSPLEDMLPIMFVDPAAGFLDQEKVRENHR